MPPHFLADLAPYRWVLLLAFLDPAVIAIGLWMGWRADQAGKLILAGLAAGLVGVVLSFLLRFVGISWFEGGYYFGGAHALFRVLGGFSWAVIGYLARRAAGRRA
ncbi:MAG: hypothetical protein U1E62_10960 [Alsobacter sp.]